MIDREIRRPEISFARASWTRQYPFIFLKQPFDLYLIVITYLLASESHYTLYTGVLCRVYNRM